MPSTEYCPTLGHKVSAWEVHIGMPDPSDPQRIRWMVWEEFDDKNLAYKEYEARMLHHMDVFHGKTFSTLRERTALITSYDGPPIHVMHVSRSIMSAAGQIE